MDVSSAWRGGLRDGDCDGMLIFFPKTSQPGPGIEAGRDHKRLPHPPLAHPPTRRRGTTGRLLGGRVHHDPRVSGRGTAPDVVQLLPEPVDTIE